MIPWVLPSDVDCCLWLDSDIIIKKDISSIFNYTDNNHYISGCCHNYSINIGDKYGISIDGKKFDSRLAINAGVILFNLRLIREEMSSNEYFSYFNKYKCKIKYADQDFFNGIFNNIIYIIDSPVCNFLVDYYQIFSSRTFRKVNIVHYYYFKKPWNTISYPLFPFFCYWRYAYKFFGIKKALLFQLVFLFYFPLRATKRVFAKVIAFFVN